MGDGVETFRRRGQFVAVAVPDIHLFAEAVEQRAAVVVEVEHAGAIFAPRTEFDFAAEMMRAISCIP